MRWNPRHVLSAFCLAAFLFPFYAWGQEARPVGVVPRATPLPHTGSNWGVFVGINRFDASVPSLRFCVEDARALREALTGPRALIPPAQSYLLASGSEGDNRPTRVNILKAIKYACESADENALLFISIATHGFDGPDGKAYILPQDGDPGLLEDTGIPLERICAFLAASRAPRKILIVDACREKAGSETRGAASAAMSAAFHRSLQNAAGQIVLAACGEGQVAHEDAGFNHGVFTRFLLEGLGGEARPNHEGFISIYTLSQYAAEKTREWCSVNRKPLQTPWLSGSIALDIPLALHPGAASTSRIPVPQPPPAEPSVPPEPVRPADRFRPGEEKTVDLGGGVVLELVFIPSGGVYLENASEAAALAKRYGGATAPGRDRFGTRAIAVDGFWMGKYEVTNAQFRRFRSQHSSGSYQRLNLDRDAQPAVRLSWSDALDFCEWLSATTRMRFTLPTVSQWEYACGGGMGKVEWEHTPDRAGQFANTYDQSAKAVLRFNRPEMPTQDGYVVTAPVGSFQGNAFGLYDMLGNAWEWCVDVEDPKMQTSVPGRNPFRALSAGAFVVRGGSWDSDPALCRASYPSGYSPVSSLFSRGFRVCAPGDSR